MESEKNNSPQEVRALITDFTHLEVWKSARQLRRQIYETTRQFPPEEKFGLASQIRRVAISVTANLAEGYGRYSYQENIQFSRQSRGSIYELRDHLTTAFDAGYIPRLVLEELDAMAIGTTRLVNGYIWATKLRKESAGTNPNRKK
ncbi:MAG: four helix bundle protein [Candidatus Acidiferrales bacterium]